METTAITISNIIHKALPDAMTVFHDNWDDTNSIFKVVPEPETIIHILISQYDEDPNVMIQFYRAQIYPSYMTELKQKLVFSGRIPKNEQGQKDWQLIEGILRNWQNFRP